MNFVYRLIWSASRRIFVPVSEITKSHHGSGLKERRSRGLPGLLILIISLGSAHAEDIQWIDAYPSYSFPDNQGINYDSLLSTGSAFTIDSAPLTNHFAPGTTLNILGPLPNFAAGSNGTSTTVSVFDALAGGGGTNAGRITSITATDSQGNITPITAENINQFTYSPSPANPQQNQELNVEIPGLEGSYQVINIYDSTTFVSAGDTPVSELMLSVYNPDSFRIYNNFGIVSVASSGGTANINVGDDTTGMTPVSAPTNTLDLLAKNSVLAKADGTGTAQSQVNWLSDNLIYFRPAAVISNDSQSISAQSAQYDYTLTIPNYVQVGQRVLQAGSRTFNITSSADIAEVNDYLTGQNAYAGKPQVQYWLTAGATVNGEVIDSAPEAQSVYNAIITGLLDQQQQTSINLTYHVWDDQASHTNNATLPVGDLNVIYATGNNAAGSVNSSGILAVDGASAVMRGDAGALLTNDGTINHWRSDSASPTSIGMQVTNATAINNGTLNAGLFLEKEGTNQDVSNAGSIAMQGLEQSTLTNNGHINIAITESTTANARGMSVSGTSSATNTSDGTIVLTGNSRNSAGRAAGYGIYAEQGASVLNQGAIYLGYAPATDATVPASVPLTGGSALTAGIYSTSSGNILNDGNIFIGDSTRNAVGIFTNSATGSLINNGSINVLGRLVNGSAASNYGLYVVDNQGSVTNNGDIFVDGDNNVAIYLQAQNAAANVTSSASSSITVGSAGDTGGSDGNVYTYRNYAVYAEGLNNQPAQVDLQATIRLLSAGAIGVHARGDAQINIGNAASLTFENDHQIGYYAWGNLAKINISNANINDNGQANSVLFAVDNGAVFNGDNGSGSGYQLTISGDSSIGVIANGVDDGGTADESDDIASSLITGPATIHVNGDNAVGVLVSGGAEGTISDGGIVLDHDNTTAVRIDGRNYNIDGTLDSDQRFTNVTSTASTTSSSSQSGITGYDISHAGNLVLNGLSGINLNGSSGKGVWLHDGGSATVNAPVSVLGNDNIGVDIQNSGTLTNNNAISVGGAANSGNVGIRVQGAGAVVDRLGSVSANGGLAALQLTGSGAALTVNGNANQITASGGADGVRMDNGASSFTASNTTIDIADSGAGINNNANTANINLNNVTINASNGPAIRTAVTFNAQGSGNVLNVSGNGQGFAFEDSNGNATTGNLTISNGYTINGSGADSIGILGKTNGSVSSGANITMGSSAGAAIAATNASSVSNSGQIETSSNTGSTVLAENASQFSNSGTINSTGSANTNPIILINGSSANRTVTNTGTISSTSSNATVIDASGSGNTTLINSGTLLAASSNGQAILTGSGADDVTLNGGNTQGEITLGSGSDQFNWNSGTFAGAINFSGGDGGDSATLGNVSLAMTRHILSEGGNDSALSFNGTSAATVGSFTADDLGKGTNIGSGWNSLTLNAADVRILDDLALSGTPEINVNNGSILRSGNNLNTSGISSLRNFDVATSGSGSQLIFDGSEDQQYSGIISGDGGMTRMGGGSTVLLGNNSYTGTTLIDGSEVSLGDGGTVGGLSTSTNIIDNGLLTINRSDAVTLNGVISGSGDFQQLGSGLTRLGGNNSWAGSTTVNFGTLLINGDQTAATGVTNVAAFSALGGNGTIGGDVIFANDTVLTPGDNGTGTLTINGNLNLNATTNSQFSLGEAYTPGGSLNDFVNVKGNLVLDGLLDVALTPGGSFLPGVYRLFNYAGSLVNNTLEINSLPPNDGGTYAIQTNIANQVNLVLNFVDPASELQFWDGEDAANHGDGTTGDGQVEGGDGVWKANIAGDTNNWTQPNGVGNAPWSQTAFAIFQGTGGQVQISNINGRVVNSGMQFTADNYVLNQLNPASALNYISTVTESFPDSLPVPANSYEAQGESVADTYYVIRVGDGASGGNITTTIDASLRQDALDTNRIRLLKTDAGRLILNGINDFSAGIEVWGGTLQVSNNASLGAPATTLTLKNAGALQAGADFSLNRNVFLDTTGGGTLDAYGHVLTVESVVAGDGDLAVVDTSAGSTTGNLAFNQANTYQGNTVIRGKAGIGQLVVDANVTGALGRENSTINVADQAQLNFNNASLAESHLFNLTSGGRMQLADNSSGGNATINTDATSFLLLSNSANAGNALINNSGQTAITDAAQAQNATIINASGGVVDISAVNGQTSVGSLSGAGNVELGSATLLEGNLGRNDTISGVISGNGGSLVKTGAGALTLTGNNTYTGTTQVSQGALLINGVQSPATGKTTVNNGATLGGNGIIGGSVTVENGGRLAAGAGIGNVGTLTMGALTLNEGAQLDYQFGEAYTTGGTYNDLINVNGNLDLNGQLNITQSSGGTFDVGVYRVLNYSGTLTNNQLVIGTAPQSADDLYVQTSIAGQVNLVNHTGAELRFWDGTGGSAGEMKDNGMIEGGDGVWQNDSGNDNWTTDTTSPAGRYNSPYSNASFAVFGGEAGNVTIDNSLGAVGITGAQFTTDGYNLDGEPLTLAARDTQIRVGDGTSSGVDYLATINASLVGNGALHKTDLGTLQLNGNNSYSGGTVISAGTIQVSADTNLGASEGGITLADGTLRYTQGFSSDRRVTLIDGGGTIDTQAFNASLTNIIAGEGELTKRGSGALILSGDNVFLGTTNIREGILQLGNGGGSGNLAGNIDNQGTLVLNRSDTFTLSGDISGSGQVWQQGSGVARLAGINSWSGLTFVEQGTLQGAAENTFSAASTHVVSQSATLDTGGYNQRVASLLNQGTVNLRGGDVGSTLTVTGNYVGSDGTLKISAQQHSPGIADRLVIDGGTASGRTLLDIDVSQLGEPTEGDGIMVVEALNGGTTTAQTTKDAFSIGADVLLSGAYQYQLFAGNAEGAGEDWFLRAGYRPDVPGFDTLGAIIRQADLAVLGTLHQRVGDEQPWRADVAEDQQSRFWMRYLVKSVEQQINDPLQSRTSSNYNGMQVGGDLYQDAQWRAGIYGTFLDNDTSISGRNGDIDNLAYNSTFSTYIGGYATWTDESGLYVDNVLQYGYHAVDLKNGRSRETVHPDGSTFAASVEIGRPWQLGNSNWKIEPQAQLIYQYSDFDSVTLDGASQTRVDVNPDGSLISRIGARLTSEYDTEYGQVKPYARVNYWTMLSNGDDKVKFANTANNAGTTTITAKQQYSMTEAALGATWAVSEKVQAYSEIGRAWNSGGDTHVEANISATVGVKMRF
ncbi:autotransporter-associated beta strand repeat-containing protein [Pantoea endophytica]|uniref:autotransporter-associated beta strand repeat-containing protein n=1 Tax=Pantoea endophytica TaxID=92488 RepID=UPI0024131EB8|nr:autotransporter-associated beta strand repeat-containing protein [Pantoea endophytica]